MSLLAECGKREQRLRIKKEELSKKYAFSIDNETQDLFTRAYAFLYRKLMREWSDRRNLSIIKDSLDKYEELNTLMEIEATFPSTESTRAKIEEMVFPSKKNSKAKEVAPVKTTDCSSVADILQYKSTAQITKMLNNTNKELTKHKPYVGLSSDVISEILRAVYDVCTKEKKTLIDKFLGGK